MLLPRNVAGQVVLERAGMDPMVDFYELCQMTCIMNQKAAGQRTRISGATQWQVSRLTIYKKPAKEKGEKGLDLLHSLIKNYMQGQSMLKQNKTITKPNKQKNKPCSRKMHVVSPV